MYAPNKLYALFYSSLIIYILEFIFLASLCICPVLFYQGCPCCEGHPPKIEHELAGMSVHEGRQEQ
jgi:hypothetical protein